MKKALKSVSVFLTIICLLLFGTVIYGESFIPDKLYIVDENQDIFPPIFKAVSTVKSVETIETDFNSSKGKYDLKVFNSIYVKEVEIQKTDREYVTPLGSAFGIKIYTDGVIVVKTDEVIGFNGSVSPAKRAGIREGDVIIQINGKKVTTNKELADSFTMSEGKPLRITARRGDLEFETFLTAEFSKSDKKYRAGIWVRDSSAGIGTLTYYDEDSGIFCGLGHAVCDVDTGQMLTLSEGEAVDAIIKGSYKGKPGNPGELCGIFGNTAIGNLIQNSKTGVYGATDSLTSVFGEVPVAMHYEVKEGQAYIISEVNENGPQKYNVNIIKLFGNGDAQEKNMVIEVTDPDLINETGGIVQGMSGSPIIQNGMLVGAVTHVLVNDPTRGYAVFAENMLQTAGILN